MDKALLLLSVLLLAPASALAGEPAALDAALGERVQALAEQATRAHLGSGLRAEVRVGRLDPRLRLAPCTDVRPHLPAGTRLWGATRIGLRCHEGAVRWNVYLPLTVDVYGPGLVAGGPLPAGHVLAAEDLRSAEVLLSAAPSPALARGDAAAGRVLARALAAGDAVRESDLKARQYFAAGDTVRIVAAGQGWRIAGEGQALAPGVEGRSVRVRTESGRIVAGLPVREREVEIDL